MVKDKIVDKKNTTEKPIKPLTTQEQLENLKNRFYEATCYCLNSNDFQNADKMAQKFIEIIAVASLNEAVTMSKNSTTSIAEAFMKSHLR